MCASTSSASIPETAELVKDWSDEDIWELRRGGHDPLKVYAAYAAAVKHAGQPTVILAKTVKGYGMGEAGEGQMITHQQKKMGVEALRKFRDRFAIPITDEKVEEVSFLAFADGSPEKKYLEEQRRKLGGPLPQRRRKSASLEVPPLSAFAAQLAQHRGSRDIDDHGLRAHPQHDAARQGARPVRRSDRAGRSRAPSAWRGCSDSSESSRRSASSTSRRMPTSSCITARTSRARCCRRASTRLAPCHRGSPRRRPTARATCR